MPLLGHGRRQPEPPWLLQLPQLRVWWWQVIAAAPAAHGLAAEWTASRQRRRGGVHSCRGCAGAGVWPLGGLCVSESDVSLPAALEAARAGRVDAGWRAWLLRPAAGRLQRLRTDRKSDKGHAEAKRAPSHCRHVRHVAAAACYGSGGSQCLGASMHA